MALDKRKLKAIECLIKGENITDTAKLAGVNRKSIYSWLNDGEFKAEMDRQIQEIKKQGEQQLLTKTHQYLEELEKIALTGKSEKNKLDALQYLINRIYGTPTSKVADVTEDKDKKEDFVNLDNIVEDIKTDNVIELDKKKAK